MDEYPGWAKRMAELQILAYRKQFNNQKISIARPSNVYGPGDNFDENNAMVIPSLISKVFKQNGTKKELKFGVMGLQKEILYFQQIVLLE